MVRTQQIMGTWSAVFDLPELFCKRHKDAKRFTKATKRNKALIQIPMCSTNIYQSYDETATQRKDGYERKVCRRLFCLERRGSREGRKQILPAGRRKNNGRIVLKCFVLPYRYNRMQIYSHSPQAAIYIYFTQA